mmetsp:Transcript_69652/g.194693  ORF Transcript_69652/g.194693 Transcript_69652/m.194693 type:complete len:299 (-) Transcript_69652:406-1302(-)
MMLESVTVRWSSTANRSFRSISESLPLLTCTSASSTSSVTSLKISVPTAASLASASAISVGVSGGGLDTASTTAASAASPEAPSAATSPSADSANASQSTSIVTASPTAASLSEVPSAGAACASFASSTSTSIFCRPTPRSPFSPTPLNTSSCTEFPSTSSSCCASSCASCSSSSSLSAALIACSRFIRRAHSSSRRVFSTAALLRPGMTLAQKFGSSTATSACSSDVSAVNELLVSRFWFFMLAVAFFSAASFPLLSHSAVLAPSTTRTRDRSSRMVSMSFSQNFWVSSSPSSSMSA